MEKEYFKDKLSMETKSILIKLLDQGYSELEYCKSYIVGYTNICGIPIIHKDAFIAYGFGLAEKIVYELDDCEELIKVVTEGQYYYIKNLIKQYREEKHDKNNISKIDPTKFYTLAYHLRIDTPDTYFKSFLELDNLFEFAKGISPNKSFPVDTKKWFWYVEIEENQIQQIRS